MTEQLKAAAQLAMEALEGVIAWDATRNYVVPYRVRDPIHAATDALRAALAADAVPRFDRAWAVSAIAAERVELITLKFAGKDYDAKRLAELDDAIRVLQPRVTPEMWAAVRKGAADAVPTEPSPRTMIDLLQDSLSSVEDYRAGIEFGAYDRKLIGRLKAAIAALTAAPQPAAEPDVPTEREGWRWVPVEPTPEMIHAVRFAGDPDRPAIGERIVAGETAYPYVGGDVALRMCHALIAAAPQPASEPQPAQWPKLERPAKVGNGRFCVGVSSRLVVEAAQRHYEYEVTPEKEAARIADGEAKMAEFQKLLAQPAPVGVDASDAPKFNTTKAGRGEVARFFAEHLKRHDFRDYIQNALAADFACALAPTLYAVRTSVVRAEGGEA